MTDNKKATFVTQSLEDFADDDVMVISKSFDINADKGRPKAIAAALNMQFAVSGLKKELTELKTNQDKYMVGIRGFILKHIFRVNFNLPEKSLFITDEASKYLHGNPMPEGSRKTNAILANANSSFFVKDR